ncbi:hypothetical protein EIP91_010124 [Steccherinum ochraceum]|uniref:AB hydrolase-1 domain-containing protein n=1 Tax=Steccherinum ochraceum TaxID=92696 RepID=A0A4R0S1Z5_9APHY|nr:hypothetical protein EIP91_010124 [Steccherinum ochraceum]
MQATTGAGRYVVSQDGTRIWADVAGNKSGIPVIFIHALACSAVVWDKQFSDRNLLDNLYMIKYELRGHGRSDHPLTAESYTTQKYAEDFMAVSEAFGVVKPFVSYGAFVPVDVAETFGPDHISGVVFSGGPGLTQDLHREKAHPYLAQILPTLQTTDANQLPHAADVFVDSCVKDPQHNLPYESRLQWLASFLMQSPTVRKYTVSRIQSTARWEREFTHKPHLLMQGTDDLHSQVDKIVAVSKRVFSNLEVVVLEGVGHAVCWEVPERHNALLLDFVRRHCANAVV